MKNLKVCGLLLLMASLTSCSKNETAKPAENPITTLLSEQLQALKLVGIRENSFRESGVVFSSSVAGKLTQLGSKLPDAGIYVVTVWDFDSGQVLLQKTVEQEVPDKLTLIDIAVLPLTINKKYLISINNKSGQRSQGSYTQAFKASGGNVLPATQGNITLHASRSGGGSMVAFPSSSANQFSLLTGFPEFTFIPD
ncbi:DUF4082 domain-containing protein [Spirosoma endbachense]|uniref:DUF4082 domain-containing protein n=1 Tax=Spirosoma endbachense TaxID=2666025 RepID=A0A6P1VRF5_9BACT|nr:DUF4082 domain-containing protein [Spirosoma endbachense]QHV94570.1 DUF4082 domain-containing protein [Spirosoma endbachense]